MIHCEQLTKSYPMGSGRKQVLKGLNLHIAPGEHIGFLDVQVKSIEADAAIRPHFLRERHCLVGAVEEICLEPVQRLERDPDPKLFG